MGVSVGQYVWVSELDIREKKREKLEAVQPDFTTLPVTSETSGGSVSVSVF